MRLVALLFTLLFFLESHSGVAIEGFSTMVKGSSQSFLVRTPHGGIITPEIATSVAKSQVLRAAMLSASNALAGQASVQFLNENNGGVNFSSFNLDGLARKICQFSEPDCNIHSEKVVCFTRATWLDNTSISEDLVTNLQEVPLLERFVALVHRNDVLLQQYDSLTQNIDASKQQKEKKILTAQLTAIATELDALMAYEELLKEYNDKWKNPQKVVAALEPLLKKKPESPLILVALAEAFTQLEMPIKALDYVDKGINLLPDVAYFYDIKGAALLLQHLPVLAESSYSKAISLAPSEAFYKTHRGYALYLLGKEEAMCEDFYQACVEGDCAALSWSREKNLCKK